MQGEIERNQWQTFLDEFSRRSQWRPSRRLRTYDPYGDRRETNRASHRHERIGRWFRRQDEDGVKTLLRFETLTEIPDTTSGTQEEASTK